MDDNARGVASKILCDLLNIPKGGSTVATDGTYLCSTFYILTILKSLFASICVQKTKLSHEIVNIQESF